MTERGSGPYRGPLNDDVHFVRLGENIYYEDTADGPVTYVRVVDESEVLGFLWFADDDLAGSFEPRRAAGSRGNNAAVSWNQVLRKAKADGLSPSEAIRGLLARGEAVPKFGHVDVGAALERLSSLGELNELARQ